MSSANLRLVPIYTTRGDLGAILRYPYLFNPSGEWIGWVTAEREVYSIYGSFVGHVSKEWRIIRSRSLEATHPTRQPPRDPGCLTPPAHFPLPPMMAELTTCVVLTGPPTSEALKITAADASWEANPSTGRIL